MRAFTPRESTFWSGPSGYFLEFLLWLALLWIMLMLYARSAY